MSATPKMELAALGDEPAQSGLDLGEVDDGFFSAVSPRSGRYTADKFRAERPEDYHQCVRLIAEGVSQERIRRLLHVHNRTVAAVAEVETVAVEEVKERIKRGLRQAVALFADSAAEELGRMRGVQRFVAGGIVVDKLRDMESELPAGTSLHLHVHARADGGLDHGALLARFGSVVGRESARQKGVVEVGSAAVGVGLAGSAGVVEVEARVEGAAGRAVAVGPAGVVEVEARVEGVPGGEPGRGGD